MLAGSIGIQVESQVEAKRLWNAVVKDRDLTTREMPEICAGITFLEGDRGVGNIRQINYTPVNKYFSYVKECVGLLDEEKLVYKYSHTEGGELGKNLASAKFTVKLTPNPEGGCTVNHTCDYDTLPGVPQDQAQIEIMKAEHGFLYEDGGLCPLQPGFIQCITCFPFPFPFPYQQ